MLTIIVVGVLIGMLVGASAAPGVLGLTNGRFAACESPYNCVSSDASDDRNSIEPFSVGAAADETWLNLQKIVTETGRTRIITITDDYLHAEVRMPLIPYVDDLELNLRPDDGLIAVRSASRVGKWDLGVNRRRVESLRRRLGKLSSATL